ncbi:MAG: NTP transferase domain-containing protein [Pseudomonadota bacterium]
MLITGLVIAGGRGERLGGIDKGLIPERGIPAAVRVAATLRETCPIVLVSANRNLESYGSMDFDAVLPDSLPGFAGPLAALLAASEYGVTGTLVTVPCDMPTLSPEVPRSLLHRLEADPELDLVYANSGDVPQYLVAALRTTCLGGLDEFLATGKRAVRRWYEQIETAACSFEDPKALGLVNRNSADDWR